MKFGWHTKSATNSAQVDPSISNLVDALAAKGGLDPNDIDHVVNSKHSSASRREGRYVIDISDKEVTASTEVTRQVIAHELSHIKAGHLNRRSLKFTLQVVQSLTVLANGCAYVAAAPGIIPKQTALIWIFSTVGLYFLVDLMIRHVGRHRETEADILAATVFDAPITEKVVEHLEQGEGRLGALLPLWMRTHPRPRERQHRVQHALNSHRQVAHGTDTTTTEEATDVSL